MMRWYLADATNETTLTGDMGGAQQKYAERQEHHEGVGRI